jgi:hypothetical protein
LNCLCLCGLCALCVRFNGGIQDHTAHMFNYLYTTVDAEAELFAESAFIYA